MALEVSWTVSWKVFQGFKGVLTLLQAGFEPVYASSRGP